MISGLCAYDPATGGFSYNSPAAAQAALAALNNALQGEGYGSVSVPTGFWSLSAPQQFKVLLNEVRADMGLRQLAWSNNLVTNAVQGAQANRDPQPPSSGWTTFGSVWSGGEGPVESLYNFLFMDGYGSDNADCTTQGAPGCWGHRAVLLGHYGPSGQIGVADTRVNGQLSLAAALMG